MQAQPTSRWRGHRLLAITLLVLVSLLYLGHASLYGSWIDDDAGISFTYARNLAQGHGLVLNPGGERVEGYSNPLWVFLLAATFRAGLFDPVATPKILSIVAALVSFLLLSRISGRVFGRSDSLVHLVPAMALACSMPFVAWSISGLENALYIVLILLAICLRLAEIDETTRPPISGIVLFLVAITRPEGVLYLGAALAHGIGVAVTRRRVTRRDAVWVAAFALPFLAYHTWHYLYFADLLPNTYYAKMQAGGAYQHLYEQVFDIHSSGWQYLLKGLGDQNLLWLLPPATLILILFGFGRKSAGGFLLLCFMLAGAFYPIFVGGDWMAQFRFLTPLYALSYLILAGVLVLAVETLTASGRAGTLHPTRAAAAVILVCVVAAIVILPAQALLDGPVKAPSVSFARIRDRGLKFKALADDLHIKNGSLLEPDLGGTSYASGLRLIDLGGLADVHIASHDYDPRYFGRYIFVEQQPTFIHTHCFWSERSGIHQSLDLRRDYLTLWESPCPQPCCTGATDGEYIRKEVFVDPAPVIDQPLELNFQGGPGLVGYRLEPRLVQPGGTARFTTWWTAVEPLSDDILLGVTAIAPDGNRLDGQERHFTRGIYPPSRWRPDEVIREEREIEIPDGATEGPFGIEVRLTGTHSPDGRIVATLQVGRQDGATPLPGESSSKLPAESSIREAEASALKGDLQSATDLLLAARGDAPVAGKLRAALSHLSTLWYRRGEELLGAADCYMRWGEAMSAFQNALACRPANAFARKRIEALRSRDYIERFYGKRLRQAQEGPADQGEAAGQGESSGLLMEIEDEGFTAELDEILQRSAPIRERLSTEGTLASLSLLHRAHEVMSDSAGMAAVQTRLDAAAPLHVNIGDQLVYLGSDFEPRGRGIFRLTWWFQVNRTIKTDYEIFLKAYPDDPSSLPADRAMDGFMKLDHFPDQPTNTWRPGTIVRHVFTGRVVPGSYRCLFGFFEPGGGKAIPVKGADSTSVQMGPFDVE